STGNMIRMVKPLQTDKAEVTHYDLAWQATTIVKDCTKSFDMLQRLASVLERKTQLAYNRSDENSLYDALMRYANEFPKDFHDSINEHKREVSDLFSLFESYEALDLNTPGTVVALKPQKKIILSDVKGKGKGMTQWMFENRFD